MMPLARIVLALVGVAVLLSGCASPLDRGDDGSDADGTLEATATTAPALTIVTPTPFVAGAPTAADPNATSSPAPNPGTYVIVEGDSLYEIALRFGVELDAIIAANGLSDPNDIQVGQELIIPPKP
jgi:lipoprotein NlpD